MQVYKCEHDYPKFDYSEGFAWFLAFRMIEVELYINNQRITRNLVSHKSNKEQ